MKTDKTSPKNLPDTDSLCSYLHKLLRLVFFFFGLTSSGCFSNVVNDITSGGSSEIIKLRWNHSRWRLYVFPSCDAVEYLGRLEADIV